MLIGSSGHRQHHYFEEERDQDQLWFGTSAMHSYVHEWSCQLIYNPRLNKGWGQSDGEGLERIWAFLAILVCVLRYATKLHRFVALHLRAGHHNEMARINAGKVIRVYEHLAIQVHPISIADLSLSLRSDFIIYKVKSLGNKFRLTVERRENALTCLEKACLELDKTHDYFSSQWAQQKASQLDLMSNGNIKRLEQVFEELQGLEEDKDESE